MRPGHTNRAWSSAGALALVLLLGPTLTAPTAAASTPGVALEVDFDLHAPLAEEFRQPVVAALERNRDRLPDTRLSVSGGRMLPSQDWVHFVLVPTRIVEAGWRTELRREDFVDVVARLSQGSYLQNGTWEAYMLGETAFAKVEQQIPSQLIDLGGRFPSLVQGLKFPWNSGATWTVGGLAWHQTNAIDVSPQGNDDAVLAADGGLLTLSCGLMGFVGTDDSEQVQLRVDHSPEITWYLHIDADTVDPCVLGQNIPRGWHLGDLYDGTVIQCNVGCSSTPDCSDLNPNDQWNTPCGCGTGPHIHWTISGPNGPCPCGGDVIVDGFDIDDVGNSPGNGYTSTNTHLDPCTPPGAGDWVVDDTCIYTANSSADGDVIVQDDSLLRVLSCGVLDIDMQNHALRVEDGSGVLIQQGGRVE